MHELHSGSRRQCPRRLCIAGPFHLSLLKKEDSSVGLYFDRVKNALYINFDLKPMLRCSMLIRENHLLVKVPVNPQGLFAAMG